MIGPVNEGFLKRFARCVNIPQLHMQRRLLSQDISPELPAGFKSAEAGRGEVFRAAAFAVCDVEFDALNVGCGF